MNPVRELIVLHNGCCLPTKCSAGETEGSLLAASSCLLDASFRSFSLQVSGGRVVDTYRLLGYQGPSSAVGPECNRAREAVLITSVNLLDALILRGGC